MDSSSKGDSWAARAFRALDTEANGHLVKDEILSLIRNQGVYHHHSLHELIKNLEAFDDAKPITYQEFCDLTHGLFFLKRVLEWEVTIPHFEIFRNNLERGYKVIKEDVKNEFQGGEVATYIPPLAKANPKWFATSFCSTDGQFTQFGDIDISFSIQSIGKVVAYAFIHDIMGEDVHQYVGEEPSGVAFNAPVFDKLGRPHNPMVNAGAIMVCSLIVH